MRAGRFRTTRMVRCSGYRERQLPAHKRGYYREYTVRTGGGTPGRQAHRLRRRRNACPMPAITPATTTRAFEKSGNEPDDVFKRRFHGAIRCGAPFPFSFAGQLAGACGHCNSWISKRKSNGDGSATSSRADTLLRGVRPNIVQSIRAFRVHDLQEAAPCWASISCMPTWPMPRPSRMCWS